MYGGTYIQYIRYTCFSAEEASSTQQAASSQAHRAGLPLGTDEGTGTLRPIKPIGIFLKHTQYSVPPPGWRKNEDKTVNKCHGFWVWARMMLLQYRSLPAACCLLLAALASGCGLVPPVICPWERLAKTEESSPDGAVPAMYPRPDAINPTFKPGAANNGTLPLPRTTPYSTIQPRRLVEG